MGNGKPETTAENSTARSATEIIATNNTTVIRKSFAISNQNFKCVVVRGVEAGGAVDREAEVAQQSVL